MDLDSIAIAAMQGLLANGGGEDMPPEELAFEAYENAVALLKERKRLKGETERRMGGIATLAHWTEFIVLVDDEKEQP